MKNPKTTWVGLFTLLGGLFLTISSLIAGGGLSTDHLPEITAGVTAILTGFGFIGASDGGA